MSYSCDKWVYLINSRCGLKPYVEVYPCGKDSWSYLCRWHYYMDVLKIKLFRKKPNKYCMLRKGDEIK